jgi:hypothetical protein
VIQTIPTIKNFNGDTMLLQAGFKAGKNVNPIQRLAKRVLTILHNENFCTSDDSGRAGDVLRADVCSGALRTVFFLILYKKTKPPIKACIARRGGGDASSGLILEDRDFNNRLSGQVHVRRASRMRPD